MEKIAQRHLSKPSTSASLHRGDLVSLRPRHVMSHDNTAPVMRKFREIGVRHVHDPAQPVICLDHDIQNDSPTNLDKYARIERFARDEGLNFFAAGSGIGHQLMVEHGFALPGAFVVAADSHANTYGALGALGTPVTRTDAAAIWASGEFWWSIPRTIRVELHGRLAPDSSGKDVILALSAAYAGGEVLNACIEFAGAGIASLTMDDRLTMANMTTEWGALAGWFPVDHRTLDYLRPRVAAARLAEWEYNPPQPDRDAAYSGRIELDLASVSPQVAGPDSPLRSRPLAELARERIRIDKAYLISCANGRRSDLERAAEIVAGKRVAQGVEFYISAASAEVERDAAEAWNCLLEAGARPLPSGCGPCIGLGLGLLEAGEVGISATNRNYRGRMGSVDATCYLASPAAVAASAVAGYIEDPYASTRKTLVHGYTALQESESKARAIEIVDGFPSRLCGRLVFVDRDALDTDAIYASTHTYRDELDARQMSRLLFENHDPRLAAELRTGDILVGGYNFGCGSSREQAVTALQAAGISLIVAGSLAQTYRRNAFNNGLAALSCPPLIERLRQLADRPNWIPGDPLVVDFERGEAIFRDERFACSRIPPLLQQLVADGGIVPQLRYLLAAFGDRS